MLTLKTKWIIILSLLFLTLYSYGQNSDFNPQEKIVKKCNDFIRLKVQNDTIYQYVYLYFENAERVFEVISDTVTIIKDYYNCTTYDTVVKMEVFYFKFDKVYILNQDGDLMHDKPFDNMKFKIPLVTTETGVDHSCGLVVYFGHNNIHDMLVYYDLKGGNEYNLHNDFQEIAYDSNGPIFIQTKDKWGTFDLHIGIIEPMVYDDIIFGDLGIEYYKGNVIAKMVPYVE